MSSNPPGPIALDPQFQHYAWGDREFIPRLFGFEGKPLPYAEAWLGAHRLSPSAAHNGDETVALDRLIARDPVRFLGAEVHSQFAELPYLVKILSAARPLSIQVHPSRAQAIAGLRRENAASIPLDSASRNYRDSNHKPELLVALTPFRALVGFRPAGEIRDALQRAAELRRLLPAWDNAPEWIERLVKAYFALPDGELLPALSAWLKRLALQADSFGQNDPEYWALECHRWFSGDHPDRGILFTLLLNLIALEPWQALFLEAGTPHAYLSGAGIEVMANSDNVLRGGLTSKHVDVAEFQKILRFESTSPFVIRTAQSEGEGSLLYRTAAEEFEVERFPIVAGGSVPSQPARGPVLLMYLGKGESNHLTVRSAGRETRLSTAGSCILENDSTYELMADGPGDVVRVSVPTRRALEFRGRKPTRLAFGTSGLRGLVSDITDLEAYINVRGFLDYEVETGDVVPGSEILLAGDLRPSTDTSSRSIMTAVAVACRDAGFTVSNQGKIPTPALSYYAFQKRLPSIMVTGSHIPFDRNGIKFNKSDGELLKSDESPVLEAVARARRQEYAKPSNASRFDDRGMFRSEALPELPPASDAARSAYVKRYVDFFPDKALRGTRVVLYQHSAVGRDILEEILHALGAEVHAMGRAETFVPIDTEAISESELEKLAGFASSAAKQFGPVDAVVSTDGDSDRPLIAAVGPGGAIRFIPGDQVGILVARYLRADAIAVPVSATDAIETVFGNGSVKIVRTRIGSPWVIAAMSELHTERAVGFEANGGFLVGSVIERGGRVLQPLATRDSVLPILALLHGAKEESGSLWEHAGSLPRRFGKSDLIDAIPATELSSLAKLFNPEAPHTIEMRAVLERRFSKTLGFGQILKLNLQDGVRIHFEGGDIAHVRASGNAPQLRIYAFANTEERAAEIVSLCVREPDGILRSLLADAAQYEFSSAILGNIKHTETFFEQSLGPKIIGIVCGSDAARRFWQQRLDEIQPAFKARETIAFHENLPVNQAFGLLLLWHRLRERLTPGDSALVAFVFGDGTRATPFTETDNGQKPAMSTFVRMAGAVADRPMSMVELALKYFSPVEAYLRRSGFDGVVVKWGDEVQIPVRDLSGQDALFNGADIVRFVCKRAMTEFEALNKDWLGVDSSGRVTAFIPRRPLAEMRQLVERGLVERRGDTLIAGINLGGIAVSRLLLEELLAEFHAEVLDASADRSKRPDLDPQFFAALTVAAIDNVEQRKKTWHQQVSELQSLRDLEKNLPGILIRIRRVFDRFAAKHGRSPRIVALDFQDQYWGDVGQHRQIFDFFLSPNDQGASGTIARALAALPETRDSHHNILVNSEIGKANVVNSVLIGCRIESGEIINSVLVGTRVRVIHANQAFDIDSTADTMTLMPRAGSYKVVSTELVIVDNGERITTLFLPDSRDVLMRVHEDTDLRDKRTNYDVPILENPISFKDAHREMSEFDPLELEKRRNAAIATVKAASLEARG
jgi:phosphomannomutase